MENNKSKNILIIFCTVIIGIFAVCLFKSVKIITSPSKAQSIDISSTITVSKGDYVKTTVKSATPTYCEYVHTLSKRRPIPLGTEYYYLFMSYDLSHCISVKADKDWGNQFQNGFATNKDGVLIEGYVQKLDKKVQPKLYTVKSNYEQNNLSINVDTDLCVDLLAVKYAKRLLISSIVTLLVVIWFIFDFKKNGLLYAEKTSAGKTATTIASSILLIAFVFMVISWQML